LEYGEAIVEVHEDAILPGEKVWVVDDLLATGGTAAAALKLLRELGADVRGVAVLVELGFLHGRNHLQPCRVEAVISEAG
jgi:adenine phosphoribosyltransferase